jgi:hypothetical protein
MPAITPSTKEATGLIDTTTLGAAHAGPAKVAASNKERGTVRDIGVPFQSGVRAEKML